MARTIRSHANRIFRHYEPHERRQTTCLRNGSFYTVSPTNIGESARRRCNEWTESMKGSMNAYYNDLRCDNTFWQRQELPERTQQSDTNTG